MTSRKLSVLNEVSYLADTDELMANSNGSVKISVANFRKVMSRMDINLIDNTNAYITVLSDSGKTLEASNTSAMTITIDSEDNVPWFDGSNMTIVGVGTGSVTIQGASGVTINKPSSRNLSLSSRYAIASIYRNSANNWTCGGDLALV
jgi:hypothetical protein